MQTMSLILQQTTCHLTVRHFFQGIIPLAGGGCASVLLEHPSGGYRTGQDADQQHPYDGRDPISSAHFSGKPVECMPFFAATCSTRQPRPS